MLFYLLLCISEVIAGILPGIFTSPIIASFCEALFVSSVFFYGCFIQITSLRVNDHDYRKVFYL